jgi:hypothetical protein
VKGQASKRRIIDFALYIAIGLAVLGFAAVYAVRAVRTGENGELPVKWIGLTGETAVLFGYVGRAMRRYWRRSRFWAGFLGFFVVHSVLYIVVLMRVERFPLLNFVFIGFAEWLALAYLLDFLLEQRARRGTPSSNQP